MHISTLSTLLFAVSTFAAPAPNPEDSTISRRDAELTIRMWNTTTFDCNWDNPHLVGTLNGVGQFAVPSNQYYDSYSLSRDLAANETITLYSAGPTDPCDGLLYSVNHLSAGCYQTQGTSQTFGCVQLQAT